MFEDLLSAAPHALPRWLLDFNLLRGFIWYVTILFILSIGLRIRFYGAVLIIARHVSESCPRVTSLLREHWLICVANGLVLRLVIYLAILGAYSGLNQFVWPRASISIEELRAFGPTKLVGVLVLASVMITIDLMLLAQVSVVDVDRVIGDLTLAESWLGGRINQLLQLLGRWNPIKKYADKTARENLAWFNDVTRNSLSLMTVQLVVRLLVAFVLFWAHVAGL